MKVSYRGRDAAGVTVEGVWCPHGVVVDLDDELVAALCVEQPDEWAVEPEPKSKADPAEKKEP